MYVIKQSLKVILFLLMIISIDTYALEVEGLNTKGDFLENILLNSSTLEVEGLITEVDFEEKAIKVENKWYYLQENTIIKRNNIRGTLESCKAISTGNYQWAKLEFDDYGRLEKLIVEYYIVEGIIKSIDLQERTITINIFKDSGLDHINDLDFNQEYLSFKLLEREYEDLDKFKMDDNIVIVAGDDNILRLIKD